jgi:hypothetical protein
MRHVCLGLTSVMLASSAAADADPMCSYTTAYSDPGIHGACFVDATAGCPIHLVMRSSVA